MQQKNVTGKCNGKSGMGNAAGKEQRGIFQMINLYKSAGRRIYLLRMMRGYTREELAERADISAKFLYEIETGRKGFSAGVLYNICGVLGVRCDYIMTGDEGENYDIQLSRTMQLFDQKQSLYISGILKEIYELCQ